MLLNNCLYIYLVFKYSVMLEQLVNTTLSLRLQVLEKKVFVDKGTEPEVLVDLKDKVDEFKEKTRGNLRKKTIFYLKKVIQKRDLLKIILIFCS